MARNKYRYRFDQFVALPRAWFHNRCPEWKALSGSAKLLYGYIKAGYNGSNNGEITLHYSQLCGVKGLSSSATIAKASRELEKGDWIHRAEFGGLPRKAVKYALTGKHDDCLEKQGGFSGGRH